MSVGRSAMESRSDRSAGDRLDLPVAESRGEVLQPGLVSVHGDDDRTGLDEPGGDGRADATGGPGHQRAVSGQVGRGGGGRRRWHDGRIGLRRSRRIAEGLEDEGGGLTGPLEARQVTGPAQLDQGRSRDAGGDRRAAAWSQSTSSSPSTTVVGTVMPPRSTSSWTMVGGSGHSSAAIWTSNARRCIRVSSERASSSASGPSHVSTLRATAPSTSPASMRRSSSSSKASDAAVGATPRRPGRAAPERSPGPGGPSPPPAPRGRRRTHRRTRRPRCPGRRGSR